MKALEIARLPVAAVQRDLGIVACGDEPNGTLAAARGRGAGLGEERKNLLTMYRTFRI